jgi:hypothetical protein
MASGAENLTVDGNSPAMALRPPRTIRGVTVKLNSKAK